MYCLQKPCLVYTVTVLSYLKLSKYKTNTSQTRVVDLQQNEVTMHSPRLESNWTLRAVVNSKVHCKLFKHAFTTTHDVFYRSNLLDATANNNRYGNCCLILIIPTVLYNYIVVLKYSNLQQLTVFISALLGMIWLMHINICMHILVVQLFNTITVIIILIHWLHSQKYD